MNKTTEFNIPFINRTLHFKMLLIFAILINTILMQPLISFCWSRAPSHCSNHMLVKIQFNPEAAFVIFRQYIISNAPIVSWRQSLRYTKETHNNMSWFSRKIYAPDAEWSFLPPCVPYCILFFCGQSYICNQRTYKYIGSACIVYGPGSAPDKISPSVAKDIIAHISRVLKFTVARHASFPWVFLGMEASPFSIHLV